MVLLPFGVILLWGVAFSVAVMMVTARNQLQTVLDAIPLGFGWLGKILISLLELIIKVSEAAYEGSAHLVASLFNGIAGYVTDNTTQGFIVSSGVTGALTYMHGTWVPATIKDAVDPVATVAHHALTKVDNLTADVADDVSSLKDTIKAQAGQTLTDANTFALANIAVAKKEAIDFAANSIDAVEKAENLAVQHAIDLAKAGEQSVADAATAAIAVVDGIARGVQGDVEDVWKYIDRIGLAGLVASIPALTILVNTIAQESGLENEACRSKVKGICGTNATAWEDLLGGLALIGFGFSLKEMAEVARPLIGVLEPIIREAA